MISVNSNVASLRAQRVLRFNQAQANLSLERLSTGLRINRASDDPAGLIASENLRSEIAGVRAGIDNATRAGNVLATAEGGLTEVSALLQQLQGLVSQSANVGGLSKEELAANQLQADSILSTIDRISGGTTFAGRPLLNGALSYNTSGVNPALLGQVQVNRVNGVPNTATTVNVAVIASARTAALGYTGGTVGAGGVSLEVTGNLGTQLLSFGSGTTVSAIATAFNAVRAATGLSATVSGGAVAIRSTAYGAGAFASVRAVAGSFAGGTGKATGRDATVVVNGTLATADGLAVSVRSGALDVAFSLGAGLNAGGLSSSFTITGGGASFLLGGRVEASAFDNIGIPSVSTASLGDVAFGALSSLRSGGANNLTSGSLVGAQKALDAAVRQVSTARGRIGTFIKYDVNATVNAMQVRLENLTDAESRIRDTDFAEEVSRLTRYQILSQVATTMLGQANDGPRLALTLLQGAFGR